MTREHLEEISVDIMNLNDVLEELAQAPQDMEIVQDVTSLIEQAKARIEEIVKFNTDRL